MSGIDRLVKSESARDPAFGSEYRRQSERLDAAVALATLRREVGMTQRQLAAATGKAQSTIARIENGAMNPSVGLLGEIADALDRKLEVRFVKT
jgi:DNA-binding XRE family transcriptional regulator